MTTGGCDLCIHMTTGLGDFQGHMTTGLPDLPEAHDTWT